jgi:hypothetical protein
MGYARVSVCVFPGEHLGRLRLMLADADLALGEQAPAAASRPPACPGGTGPLYPADKVRELSGLQVEGRVYAFVPRGG